jgi:N-acetylglucosaminyl-diphospho-decaprenol L-rhamnosyltransferase
MIYDVTISIISMNNGKMLSKCLDSIIDNTQNINYEIQVVAYLFNKEVLSELKQKYSTVNFIVNDKITGFAENNNIILKNSNSNFFFVLNDDTYFEGDLISKLIETLYLLEENVAFVSPVLYYPDGRTQFNGREKYTWIDYVLVKLHLERLKTTSRYSNKSGVYQTYNISGACFMVKSKIMKELGLFNEKYFFCPEDIELSTIANEKGYKAYVNANLSITHIHEASSTPIKAAISPIATLGTIDFVGRNSKFLLIMLKVFTLILSILKLSLSLLNFNIKQRRIHYYSMYWTVKYLFTSISYKELFVKLYSKVKSEI